MAAGSARFTKQQMIMMTPQMAGELSYWVEVGVDVSASAVGRQAVEIGMAALRKKWIKTYGPVDDEHLTRCVDQMRAQGDAQVRRRRAYDYDTRKPLSPPELADGGVPTWTETEQALAANPELVERIEEAITHPETRMTRRGRPKRAESKESNADAA